MTPEQERLHLKKCDYNLGYCDLNDPQCECEATPTTAEQERAEIRKALESKEAKYLCECAFANAPTWLRNSLDREEQLIGYIDTVESDLKYFTEKVAEQDKEIQRLRDALEQMDDRKNAMMPRSQMARIAKETIDQS